MPIVLAMVEGFMLDFLKVTSQMVGMSDQLVSDAAQLSRKLEWADELLQRLALDQAKFVSQCQTYGPHLAFTSASPIEPLAIVPFCPIKTPHTVVATDGSQIAPSRHEVAFCYLINIGRVCLHYGVSQYPLLDSIPEVYYKSEDLYKARKWGIQTEEWMGAQRRVAEVSALTELCLHQRGTVPLLALEDGSLIHWHLEGYPPEARNQILSPILACWDRLAAERIPLAGYVSSPRSGEVTNFFRLLLCPYPEPNCAGHCGQIPLEDAPCSKLQPLRDASLWQRQLVPGSATSFWQSQASILQEYGPHQIYVTYLHVGSEIARVEMPAWTALDPELRRQSLEIILSQVQKGYGYPVALAEAHNQAVVTGSDRRRFFMVLEQQLLKSGARHVGTSFKEARKRHGIA